MTDALVLFAKYPVPGKVMTRLGAEIGMEEAARIQRSFIQRLVVEHGQQEYAFYLSTPTEEEAKRFSEDFDHEVLVQVEGDLGQRMHEAFESLLESHDRVVIIGADVPDISSSDVAHALASLERVDLVVGPAEDGGYYLIGLKRCADLFSGVAWSTSSVLRETLRRALAAQMSFSLLARRRDVDTKEDLDAYEDGAGRI